MKFLLVASFPNSLIKFRGVLLEAIQHAGYEVHVACPGILDERGLCDELEVLGIKVHDINLNRTGLNPFADLISFFSLWSLMRNVKPDYVLCYTIKPVIYGVLAAWLASVPNRVALITGLGYTFQNSEGDFRRAFLHKIVQKLYKFVLKKTKVVFFQNPDDEILFRKLFLLPTNTRSVVVNGSGVSVDQFTVTPLPRESRFLLIARLLGDKGVREYFEAAKIIKARYPATVFLLVGWIDKNPDAIAQQELDSWRVSGIIDYLGKLEDVRPAIENCSVYVLPSYREGTPRTVLEAMAMGRAIITTDAPGCKETVVDGDNGFLVPVKSVSELVAAMEKFILDKDLAVCMGHRSREIAVEKYDVHKVNALMLMEMGVS
ncbi:glycosyltransferase family 4 protein [Vreelandella profundi]|uniref:glycosyltransferase family 4 protein n=1 Tax=Vreelandella profundi TaxID=2852117 RepID=UPI001EF0990F|nr:glycosyltransferase family 4 protein [Halomonas profundi]